MRTLSVNGQAAIDTKLGGEPVRYLEIQWADGTFSRHADKLIDGFAKGDIITLSSIAQTMNYSGNLSNLQFSVTLNDTDGELKDRLDSFDIHKRPCILYQWFTGLPLSDAFELFRGQIYAPITWNEGSRTLSFDVVSPIYGREVGFSLEEGQFSFVPDELYGKAWPVCFGSVLNVPATKVNDVATGTVRSLFGVPDSTLKWKKKYMQNQLMLLGRSYGIYRLMEERCHMMTLDYTIVTQVITISGDHKGSNQFVISTSGSTSDAFYCVGDAALVDKIVLFLKEATDYMVTEIEAQSPGGSINDDYENITVSKSGNNIVISGWPYPINVDSFDAEADGKEPPLVYSTITAVEMEDGTEMDADELQEAILKRPVTLRDEYIELIKEEDSLKQTLEDKKLLLDEGYAKYDVALQAYNANKTPATKDNLAGLLAERKTLISDVADAEAELYRTSYDKQICEVNISNLTLIFDIVGKVRKHQKEIVDNYVQLHKSYARLAQIIDNQETYLGATTTITGSQFFDQGELNVAIGRGRLHGTLDGNEFTYDTINNDADNVEIAERQNADIDTFWIADETLMLKGKYCRLPNNRVIKVVDQVGTQCRFTPVKTSESTRNRNKEFPLTGPNEDALRKGLGDLLTGNETPAELLWLLNTLPSDISADAKRKLTGASAIFKYRLKADKPIVGTFEEGYGASTVYNGDKIDLDKSRYYFFISQQSKTKKSKDLRLDASLSEIKDAILSIVDMPADDVEVTGDPLIGDYFVIGTITIEFTNPANMYKYNLFTNDIIYEIDGSFSIASMYEWKESTGAHEYTRKTRENKIQTAYDQSKYGREMTKLQERIRKFTKQIDAAAKKGIDLTAKQKVLTDDLARYNKLMSLTQLPKSTIEEANKIISKEEYNNIFQLELLQYLYVKRYINNIGHFLPDPADEYFFTGRDITLITEVSEILPAHWLEWLGGLDFESFMNEVRMLPDCEAWVANVGDTFKSDADNQVVFVANMLPSTVKAVYAYQTVDGHKRFTPIPSSYYTLDEGYVYPPLVCTVLTLKRPLTEYVDENWEDQIYVSLTSSVGPNPVDVIQWLAETYTTLTVDTTSFTAVKALVANYPTHFALLDKQDSLKLIEEIAFQSRCAVWVDRGKLKITYLPLMPASVMTITETDIEVNSLELSFTETDDLVTKSESTYRVTYDQQKDYKIILRSNLNKYGEQKDDYNYYALTNRDLVLKSATYWLIHKANTWKLVTLRGFLNLLKLEPFDTVQLDLVESIVSTGPVYCRVMNVTYDSDADSVSLQLWVPIRCGEMTAYTFAWPANLTVTDVYPPPEEILSGTAGNSFNSDVPLGVPYDPYDNSLLAFRPNDYGGITPTDSADTAPLDPTTGMSPAGNASPFKIQQFNPIPEVDKLDDLVRFGDVAGEFGDNPQPVEFDMEKLAEDPAVWPTLTKTQAQDGRELTAKITRLLVMLDNRWWEDPPTPTVQMTFEVQFNERFANDHIQPIHVPHWHVFDDPGNIPNNGYMAFLRANYAAYPEVGDTLVFFFKPGKGYVIKTIIRGEAK